MLYILPCLMLCIPRITVGYVRRFDTQGSKLSNINALEFQFCLNTVDATFAALSIFHHILDYSTFGCSFCSYGGESIEHVFRDCPWTKNIWMQISNGLASSWNTSWSFLEWLRRNLLENKLINGNQWTTLFGIGTWLIWKWRNENKFNSTEVIQNPIRCILFEVEAASVANATSYRVKAPSAAELLYIRWHPPDEGWVKINTDGARKDDSELASCGGLIRGPAGQWLGGFYAMIGKCQAIQAELWGALFGLKEAWDCGFRKIILEGDSKEVVEAIKMRKGGKLTDQNLFLELCALLDRDWEVRVQHVYREANKCADRLANFSEVGVACHTRLENPPEYLKALLRDDILGRTTPRFIMKT